MTTSLFNHPDSASAKPCPICSSEPWVFCYSGDDTPRVRCDSKERECGMVGSGLAMEKWNSLPRYSSRKEAMDLLLTFRREIMALLRETQSSDFGTPTHKLFHYQPAVDAFDALALKLVGPDEFLKLDKDTSAAEYAAEYL